jgi:hypothetical protein
LQRGEVFHSKHWENTKWLCEQEGIAFKYNELTKNTDLGISLTKVKISDILII